jgi:O-antigen/teichoic acid export membrane protein
VSGYLRRLATTGAAYTASSVGAKLIAVALLPLYTRHLEPRDYGAAEVLLASVIAASIVIRLGVIEALLRFYYRTEERPERVVSTAFASLALTSTAGAAIALALAAPISRALLGHADPGLARIAVLGLWVFTNYELLLALFRLDERGRAYFAATMSNVLITVGLTVWLVVVEDKGASGLLLGNFLGSAVLLAVLLGLNFGRLSLLPDVPLLRRMMRFGLPTMPAELSLYSLSFIDRIILVRKAGLAEAGLYSLAVKFAQAVTVLVRGFQLAWPPLAYSIQDDDEARRAYALIVTWFLAVCAFVVTGLALEARWIVRLLAAPEFFDSYKAVPLLATGVTLYALYLVLVVVVGRTGRTEFNFPVTVVATVANVALNLALVPPLGIVGAGIALIASYLLMLTLMYLTTKRLFPVPFQWLRLAQVLVISGGLVAAAEPTLPTDGAGGLLSRAAVWLAYPPLLWATGFLSKGERAAMRSLWGQAKTRLTQDRTLGGPDSRLRESGFSPSESFQDPDALRRGPQLVEEVYEAEARDQDRPSG